MNKYLFNLDEKYFFDCNDKINELSKNKIYILGLIVSNSFEINKPLKMLLQPKNLEKHISINEDRISMLYLTKSDEDYIWDFSLNYKDRIIQLSRATLDGEIEIHNEQSQENAILNSDNFYFKFGESDFGIFNGKLTIKVNRNTLIEFLMNYGNEDI